MNLRAFNLYCLLLLAFFVNGQPTDSLHAELAKRSGKDRVEVLHQLVITIWLNYPEQAMEYGEEALQISRDANDKILESQSLRLIAGVHYYQGDYETSLDFNIRALNMALEVGDSVLINNGYNNLGLLYYNIGDYQTSLDYLLRSIAIKRRIKETYGLATTINNIGRVFEHVGDFKTARMHFSDALQVALDNDVPDQVVFSRNNIGNTYIKEENYEEALDYFIKGRQVAEEIGNINWGAVSLRGIGAVMQSRGDYDSANYYFHKSLKDCREISDKKGISESYHMFARLALEEKSLIAAQAMLDSSHLYAKELKLRKQLLENLQLYTSVYTQLNDFEKVADYQARYINLRDSLFQDVISRNLTLIPQKIDDEADRIELAKQRTTLEARNRIYITSILLIVPLAGFLVLLLIKNRSKTKELLKNTEEIKRTQKLLITSEKLASLGLLSAGIGHEINNPLNFIKNGSLALKKVLKKEGVNDEHFQPHFHAIDEGVERATSIVKSLGNFSRGSHEMTEACDVKGIVKNCLVMLQNNTRGRVEFNVDIVDDCMVLGNEGRLHQAFLNIISNAEQAIEKKGQIVISGSKNEDSLHLTVKDNGMGIGEESIPKISDPFYTTKDPGSGTGLGLFITFSIIEEHGGTIDIESKLGIGTTVTVTLPLHNE